MVERLNGIQEVASSILVGSTSLSSGGEGGRAETQGRPLGAFGQRRQKECGPLAFDLLQPLGTGPKARRHLRLALSARLANSATLQRPRENLRRLLARHAARANEPDRGRCEQPRRERDRIPPFLESLAEYPNTLGGYQGHDDVGRPVQIKIVGDYALTYWADHPVKEVKVTRIEKLTGIDSARRF